MPVQTLHPVNILLTFIRQVVHAQDISKTSPSLMVGLQAV